MQASFPPDFPPFLLKRRSFTVGLAGLAFSALPWPAHALVGKPTVSSGPNFFTPDEFAMLEHLCERIFPRDEVGPGACDLGVPLYIDGQMNTPYGYASRWYMHAPFVDGPPEAGYQLPYAPRQLYRLSLELLNAYCKSTWDIPLTALTPEKQVELLEQLEKGEILLGPVPGDVFFELLRSNTLEGAFCDPIHGGNRLMGGWKMTGFPGARADFMDWVNQQGAPYPYGPVSIPVLLPKTEEQG